MASASVPVEAELRPGPAAVPAENRFKVLDSFLFYGTFGVLLLGPLAFGAVEAWAIFLLEMAATVLLLLWTARQLLSGCLQITWNPLFAPMLGFGGILAVQIALHTSAYRYATANSALIYGVYGILSFLAVQSLQRSSQVKALAWIFSIFGSTLALFSIVQSIAGNGKLYWLRTPRFGGWIYGPYVNHNHYAGLMEMLFPIALVLALSRHPRRDVRYLPALAVVLMASTIFLCGSRGGMIAFVVQVATLGFIMKARKNRATLTAPLVLVGIAALVLWAGGAAFMTRVASIHSEARSELNTGLRFRIYRDGLGMFTYKPVLGWGLGTFPTVYPQFRSFYTNKFVNHAHNDYVQLLVETGLSGAIVILWFLASLYRGGWRKLGNWQEDLNAAVALAALMGCTGILVHGLLDSNLQVPANAALFYTLAAIATANTKFGSHRRLRHHRHSMPPA